MDRVVDVADGCIPVPDELVLAIFVVVGLALLLWFFVLPALILVFDLFVIFVAAMLAAAFRILFRRPWNVVAETAGVPAERHDIPVVGWRASRAKVQALAVAIQERGGPVPR